MYFKNWWDQQDQNTKTKFKQIVEEGRFEFVNGGWVASDEACPSFREILQNMIVGHEFLWSEFKIRPKFAW